MTSRQLSSYAALLTIAVIAICFAFHGSVPKPQDSSLSDAHVAHVLTGAPAVHDFKDIPTAGLQGRVAKSTWRGERDAAIAWRLRGLIERGALSELEQELAAGADPNVDSVSHGGAGQTPLSMAFFYRRYDAAVVLLQAGADPRLAFPEDYADMTGSGDRSPVLVRFIEARVVPAALGALPRHFESLRVLASTVSRLLGLEGLFQFQDLALALSTLSGDRGAALDILDRGANPYARLRRSQGSVLPMDIATFMREYDLIDAFLQKAGPPPVDHWRQWSHRYTPLARAAASGDVGQTQRLLARGEAIDGPELDPAHGDTYPRDPSPLYHAAQNGQLKAVRALIEAGSDVGARFSPVPETVLAGGIFGGNPAVVTELLARGAPVRTEYFDALLLAVSLNVAEVIPVLWSAGSRLAAPHDVVVGGARPPETSDPLCYAILLHHNESVAALLAAGADADEMGVLRRHHEAVAALLGGAGESSRWGNAGLEMAPVEWAALVGNREALRMLIEAGAELNCLWKRGPDGLTALERARRRGWDDVARMIEDAMAAQGD